MTKDRNTDHSPLRSVRMPRTSSRVGPRYRWFLSAAVIGSLIGLSSGAPVLAASAPKISPSFVAKVQNFCAGLTSSESKFGTFPYPTFDPTNPQPSLLKKVGEYFDKALSVEKAVPASLRALGEPAAGVTTWNKLRALIEQYMEFAEEQAKDATAGEAKPFVAAVKSLTAVQKKFNSLAKAAGFATTSPCTIFFG